VVVYMCVSVCVPVPLFLSVFVSRFVSCVWRVWSVSVYVSVNACVGVGA